MPQHHYDLTLTSHDLSSYGSYKIFKIDTTLVRFFCKHTPVQINYKCYISTFIL